MMNRKRVSGWWREKGKRLVHSLEFMHQSIADKHLTISKCWYAFWVKYWQHWQFHCTTKEKMYECYFIVSRWQWQHHLSVSKRQKNKPSHPSSGAPRPPSDDGMFSDIELIGISSQPKARHEDASCNIQEFFDKSYTTTGAVGKAKQYWNCKICLYVSLHFINTTKAINIMHSQKKWPHVCYHATSYNTVSSHWVCSWGMLPTSLKLDTLLTS